MIRPSIFEEDHLTPIAVGDGWLAAFSSLDGQLHHIAAGAHAPGCYTRTSLSHVADPLCIPGVPFVYEIELAGGAVTVRKTPILAAGLGEPREWESPVPAVDRHEVSAIVPGPRGAVCMVCDPAVDGEARLIVDAATGELRGSVAPDEAPAGVLADGTIVSERVGGGWVSRTPDGFSQRASGSVVSVCGGFALVRDATSFSIVRPRQVERIDAPQGWTLLAAAACDRVVVAYAAHPTRGQRLLARDPRSGAFSVLADGCGTAQVFSMSAATYPVARCAGLRDGSHWRSQDLRIAGAAQPRADIDVDQLSVAGLPCVLARSANARTARLVVCLHGGPDSHELDDLRYGGAYRALLERGCCCLVVNYPGSTAFGQDFQQRAWRDWHEAVRRVAQAVGEIGARARCTEIAILGVSFGAWIGLQLAAHLDGVVRVVAMSPILDLAAHIELHDADDGTFAAWARARFGDPAACAVAGDARAQACASPVTVLAPAEDQVVLPDQTQRAVAAARAKGLAWELERVAGHHYPRTAADAAVRWSRLVSIVGA